MTDISWQIITVKLSQLTPWEQNPKTSTAKNAQQLVSSVDELGQFQTVAIGPFDASGMATVYDGHQRLSAWLRQFGADYEAQALQASRPLSEQERRKIAIYSRQIGAWDWDILSGWEPEELTGWGFDVDLLSDWRRDVAALGNFLESEAAPLGDGDAEPQTNRAEELRQEWGVEPGQLWRLPSRTPGQEHRLICGDCTDEAVVERVMGGEKADLCFTDPPYNVGKDYGEETNDSRSDDDYKRWSALWFARASDVTDAIVFTPGAVNLWMWSDIKKPKWMAIWVKKNQQSRNRAGGWNAYEPFLCYGKVKIDYDVWEYEVKLVSEDKAEASHVVPKSVGAWQGILEKVIHSGITVYEPFAGSGTTLIACQNLARRCRAVEISPAYVAVALQRYLDAFGIRAELISED
jgi:DNA modification methylase